MFMAYRRPLFRGDSVKRIEQCLEIINDMEQQGYTLSLRQLFYQFVKRAWLANSEKEYKKLGKLVKDARETGLISWLSIEDRGRGCVWPAVEDDPRKLLEDLWLSLQLDYWEFQDTYLEVWVEKDALTQVVTKACRPLRAPRMACKGYLSASESWRAGMRFQDARDRGKRCVLIHLADHDPSGLDMTRDNAARLEMFSEGEVDVRRIALNMDQVKKHRPPPNPAKVTDSRYRTYVTEYGRESWELDALDPSTLVEVIQEAIHEHIDQKQWKEAEREEKRLRKESGLMELHQFFPELKKRWPTIERYLKMKKAEGAL